MNLASTTAALTIVLAMNACSRSNGVAPRAPSATEQFSVTKKLGRFDLDASSFELAKLYPGARVIHDPEKARITILGGIDDPALVELEHGTMTVNRIWVRAQRNLAVVAKARPNARCRPDGILGTSCRDPNDPEIGYWLERQLIESDVPIGRVQGTAISMVTWTPSKRPTIVLDPSADSTPPPTSSVPPTLLEGHRIAGQKYIVPDDETKMQIMDAGEDKVIGSFKMCIDVSGTVTALAMLKSTTFEAYDTKILREMRTWKYSPYRVNGEAVPVCTAVTFIYSQK